MMRELTIENYRCFEKLHVKDLAQVNLIVGKNNVGKTSFLEAVYLYVSKGWPIAWLETLSARDLTNENFFRIEDSDLKNNYFINGLFHIPATVPLSIFSIKSNLDFELTTCLTQVKDKNPFQFRLNIPPAFLLSTVIDKTDSGIDREILFPVQADYSTSSLGIRHASITIHQPEDSAAPSYFIEVRGLEFSQLRNLWDLISLTPEEDDVEKAMQILEPQLERIGFSNSQSSLSGIKIRLKGKPDPVPLSSLGDGMRRLLGIAMGLAASKSGYLIIDEIDMGLHYGVQESMWRLVLETAKRLNVQVFATTHSWDCIAAFQAALAEMEDQSIGKLIRLDARGDQLRAIEYDAEDLEITVAQGIEVR
jgi:hypothetical protein